MLPSQVPPILRNMGKVLVWVSLSVHRSVHRSEYCCKNFNPLILCEIYFVLSMCLHWIPVIKIFITLTTLHAMKSLEKLVFRFTSCTLTMYFFKVYYVVLTLSWVLNDLNVTNITIAWFIFILQFSDIPSICLLICFFIPHCVNNLSQMKNSSYL